MDGWQQVKLEMAKLTYKHYGPPLEVGMVTKHPDGRTVKILSGHFLDPVYGRLSNFWNWREVLPDGTLSETLESGYGWKVVEAE